MGDEKEQKRDAPTRALQEMAKAVRELSPQVSRAGGWGSVRGKMVLAELQAATRDDYSQVEAYLKIERPPFSTVSHEELIVLLDLLCDELEAKQGAEIFETVMGTVQYNNRQGALFLPIAGLSWRMTLRLSFGEVSIGNASVLGDDLKVYVEDWAGADESGSRIIAWHSIREFPYMMIPLSRFIYAIDRVAWLELANRTLAILRLWQMFVWGRSGRFGKHGLARIRLGPNTRETPVCAYAVHESGGQSRTGVRVVVPPVQAVRTMSWREMRLVALEGTADRVFGDAVLQAIGRRNRWAFKGNDFEQRFLTALQLLNRSYESDDEREIILFNVMILETLFNVYYGERVRGIQDSVATTYAVVLESDAGERTKLMAQVKDMYELRSKAVHSWKGGCRSEDVEQSDSLAIRGIAAIGMLLDTTDSVKAFETQLRDAYLKVAVPFWGGAGRPPQ